MPARTAEGNRVNISEETGCLALSVLNSRSGSIHSLWPCEIVSLISSH
jgi:hypothetical protein